MVPEDSALSCRFAWDLCISFGFSWGAGVPTSCSQCLESLPTAEERGWGPAWVRLSWTQLGGADHKSAAPNKCYKDKNSDRNPQAFSHHPQEVLRIQTGGVRMYGHYFSKLDF